MLIRRHRLQAGPLASIYLDRGEVAKGYYFKFGIYTVRPFESPLIVYHRAYQRGPNPYAVRATEKIFRSPY